MFLFGVSLKWPPEGMLYFCSVAVSPHTQNFLPGESPVVLTWSFPHGLQPLFKKAGSMGRALLAIGSRSEHDSWLDRKGGYQRIQIFVCTVCGRVRRSSVQSDCYYVCGPWLLRNCSESLHNFSSDSLHFIAFSGPALLSPPSGNIPAFCFENTTTEQCTWPYTHTVFSFTLPSGFCNIVTENSAHNFLKKHGYTWVSG